MAKAKKTNRQPTPSKIKLTIKVDKEIRRKLRILAAEKDISISAFIEEIFNEIPHKAEAAKREEAHRRSDELRHIALRAHPRPSIRIGG
jgi:hypothetical protein